VRDTLFALLRASPFVRDGVRNIERWHETRAAAVQR
jgi:ornithine lipid ester-linked acyl 2-hydroxylase